MKHWVMMLTLVVGMMSAVGHAQPCPGEGRRGGKGGDGPGPHHEKFMKARSEALRQKVGLTEEKASAVEAIMLQFRDQRWEIKERIQSLHEELEALVEADSSDDAAYTRLAADLRGALQEMEALKVAEWDAVSAILSPKEQARMMVLRHKLHMKKMKHFHKGKKGFGPGPEGFDE
jgi:Spy/CpxP family protein refolding chaperone